MMMIYRVNNAGQVQLFSVMVPPPIPPPPGIAQRLNISASSAPVIQLPSTTSGNCN